MPPSSLAFLAQKFTLLVKVSRLGSAWQQLMNRIQSHVDKEKYTFRVFHLINKLYPFFPLRVLENVKV